MTNLPCPAILTFLSILNCFKNINRRNSEHEKVIIIKRMNLCQTSPRKLFFKAKYPICFWQKNYLVMKSSDIVIKRPSEKLRSIFVEAYAGHRIRDTFAKQAIPRESIIYSYVSSTTRQKSTTLVKMQISDLNAGLKIRLNHKNNN